jgi:hypothetical protein
LGIDDWIVTIVNVFGEAVRSLRQLWLTPFVERLPAPFDEHVECPGPFEPA